MKRKKNPSFYKYGYHSTKKVFLSDIIESGYLKPNFGRNMSLFWKKDYYNIIEENFIPLFFFISEKTLIRKGYNFKNHVILKIDVNEYDQYPDLPLFEGNSKVKIEDSLIYFQNNVDIPNILYEYFENKIWTKKQLFANRGLCEAIIKYTGSFTIIDEIPIQNIEEIIKIK